MTHHHRRCKGNYGAMLLGSIMALGFLLALLGIALAGVRNSVKFRELAELKTEALLHAVNTIEALKVDENPVASSRKEGRCIVRWNVQEFTPSTFLLEVLVEKENGQRILVLRTLRKKRIHAP